MSVTLRKQPGISALLTLLISVTFSVISPAYAVEEEEDFTLLDLEDLMKIRVIRNAATALTSHIHQKGEWMFGYHLMDMNMETNRDGTSDLTDADVLAAFPITPTSMDMRMHMFHAMYAVSDDLTVMLMTNYHDNSMDHLTRMGMRFTTESKGIGDTALTGNFVVKRSPGDKRLFSVKGGVSLPTGSIDERDVTPMGLVRLPYPMQLGSGTYDLKLGANYQMYEDSWSIGLGGMGTFRVGENDNDYTLGDMLDLEFWYSYEWTQYLTSSITLEASSWGNIDGADPLQNPQMVPTADPNRRAGKRVDLLLDFELYAAQGKLKGIRIALQVGVPVYQDLDGPQMAVDRMTMVGWQWIF